MEVYVPEGLHKILSRFQNHSIDAQIVRVEAADGKKLTISSEYGTLNINVSEIIELIPLAYSINKKLKKEL
jgi:hypothetical protein